MRYSNHTACHSGVHIILAISSGKAAGAEKETNEIACLSVIGLHFSPLTLSFFFLYCCTL
ncbi:hypothetical protein P168DRAFT_140588 [Aspergillus campestris IBT 28561]|uniref:Uncharacterized protein n=1 Tax=Aspergillus campestris (strain IBT 28561) TaxID=1392248 RepID=A0A2I1D4Q9_ASPC2|nr:uncharacterized protein P168DRAFT_140588 [Aspergillus campestris IBT 28561]PKY04862.1 hypothetical protein P168DRAFT_140588 [Aspergillus campestris IBT 28561]